MKKVKLKYKSVQVLPQTVCDAVMSNDMKRSLTDILAEKVSKVGDDTVAGELEMSKGIHSDDYEEGMAGYKLGKGADGSYLQVDVLKVLKRTDMNEVRIASIKHVGGAMVISPASCTIAKIDIITGGYKCYFSATDGERTINNEWKVGDQAICKSYNLATNHYYWRKVTDVSSSPVNGYHYIVLSITDRDTDSEEPLVGDDVICLGNRTDTDRQAAIVLDSEGTGAPILLQLDGINSYSIDDSNIVSQLSKTNNIIRGQQIEVVTMSGNKSMQDFADEALTNAKGYTDKREEFLQTQITQNANNITLKADKTLVNGIEDRVTKAEASIKVNANGISANAGNITALGSRVTTAETNIKVNSDGLSSVVSRSIDVYRVYDKDSSDYYEGVMPTCYLEGYDIGQDGYTHGLGCLVVGSQYCTMMIGLTNSKGGDRLRFSHPVNIYYWDGDNSAADDLIAMINEGAIDEQDLGGMPLSGYPAGYIDIAADGPQEAEGYIYNPGFEYAANTDLVIDEKIASNGVLAVKFLASYKDSFRAYLFAERANAESRIKQTADSIEAKVGNTGIDINNKQITLSASNTIVKGDLSVQRVLTYYADGSIRSAYNGNGNGTIVYYYPNGNKMREDVFEYDADGNATGMSTIYYKADGSISWKLTQNGFETTLSDYWTYEEGMAYTSTISEVRKAIAAYKTSGSIGLPTSVFSTFVATSGSLNQSYNGRVVQGRVATSALPKPQTPYSGYYFDPSPMQKVAEQGSSAVVMFFRVKYVNAGKVESVTDYEVI